MTSMTRCVALAMLTLSVCIAAGAQTPKSGKNLVTVRGQQQEVYYLPAAGAGAHRKVLFAPGDGGWRGFAVSIAQNLSAAGFDVYGLDTRRYLQSFTGDSVLKTSEIAADFRQLAQWTQQGSHDRVLLLGWSEGAGLGLAAASDPASRDTFVGVVAVGVTEFNILAWRWKDLAAEIAKSLPNEPTFKSADFMAKVSPLPLYMIAPSTDEYVTPAATRALFAAAREPKRMVTIKASDHKFGGNTDEFFRTLKGGLLWIQQPPR